MLGIVILIIELNFFLKEKIQRGLKIVHYLFEYGIACFKAHALHFRKQLTVSYLFLSSSPICHSSHQPTLKCQLF